MDAVLGRKVLDHVVAHRDQFDMGSWGYTNSVCGTSACLAGWAMLLSGYTLDENDDTFHRPDGVRVRDEGSEAQQLLGLTDTERYGQGDIDESLFTLDEDEAISCFRALVETAEAAERADD